MTHYRDEFEELFKEVKWIKKAVDREISQVTYFHGIEELITERPTLVFNLAPTKPLQSYV